MNHMPPMPPQRPTVPRAVSAMLQQSVARAATIQDLSFKFQRALQTMQSECQSLAIAARFDERVMNGLGLSQAAIMQSAEQVLLALEQAAHVELAVQGELKRWLGGFPPGNLMQPPPPPAPPPATGPTPAPAIHAPVQQTPVGQVPATGPIPVQTFTSPDAARAAVEGSNGTSPVVAQPAPVPVPAAKSAS